jgi:hypothetical protein
MAGGLAIGEGRVFRRIDRRGNLGPTLCRDCGGPGRHDFRTTSPGIRCALGSQRQPRGPGAWGRDTSRHHWG